MVNLADSFETAADAIVSGDIVTLQRLLHGNPSLTGTRSTREHSCTLLHYLGANGFEDYRQKSPRNAVEIAVLLLRRGAAVDAPMSVKSGSGTTLGLVATSVHTHRAGTQIPLLETLVNHGASVNGLPGSWNPLMAALENDRPEAAVFLAEHGATIDLEGAAGVGNLAVVQSFFNHDGTLRANATQRQLASGFVSACEYGRRDVVRFLLDKEWILQRVRIPPNCSASGGAPRAVGNHEAPDQSWGSVGSAQLLGGTVLDQALWSAHNGEPDVDFAPLWNCCLRRAPN